MNPDPESAHPILIIDTASPTTTVGLGVSDTEWCWLDSDRESGVAVFQLVARMVGARAIPLTSLRTLAYCDGPGSMLGIRTAAMALRTWVASGCLGQARMTAYSSLALAAVFLLSSLFIVMIIFRFLPGGRRTDQY